MTAPAKANNIMNYAPRDSKSYLNWSISTNQELNIIAVDQANFNLTWLVFPEIEEQGLEMLPSDYIEDVNKYFDKQTRAYLATLPLSFVRYFARKTQAGELAISVSMPSDYLTRMTRQAHKAQARLIATEGNIIRPQFWRAA